MKFHVLCLLEDCVSTSRLRVSNVMSQGNKSENQIRPWVSIKQVDFTDKPTGNYQKWHQKLLRKLFAQYKKKLFLIQYCPQIPFENFCKLARKCLDKNYF